MLPTLNHVYLGTFIFCRHLSSNNNNNTTSHGAGKRVVCIPLFQHFFAFCTAGKLCDCNSTNKVVRSKLSQNHYTHFMQFIL